MPQVEGLGVGIGKDRGDGKPMDGLRGLPKDLTIQSLVTQIKACVEEDQEIEGVLNKLLAERKNLEARIDRIMFPVEAHSLKQNIEGLKKKISLTSVTAFSLSSKVRRLDVAQARLEDGIKRVEKIVNLKMTIDKVNLMIQSREYKKAATLTHEVLHKSNPGQLHNDSSVEVLRELEEKLVKLVLKECDRAAVKASEAAKRNARLGETKRKDEKMGDDLQSEMKEQVDSTEEDNVSPEFRRVFNLCLVLALLNKKHQGLGRYCFAARTMLVLGSKKMQIHGKAGNIKYCDRLSEMLDAIAYCIQLHSNSLREHFGPGSELRLIQELVQECDSKIHQLIQQFMEFKKIAKIVKGVQKLRRTQRNRDSKREDEKSSRNFEGGYEPKMLDGLLEEIAYICREIQIFDYNVRQRGDTAREELKSTPSQADLLKAMIHHPLKDTLPRTTKVNQLQQELTGNYIVIEEYFMTQDVQTAIDLDDNQEDSQTSSMVDDVFYILKKCSERAFSTCDVNSACAIVNLLNSMLETLYKEQLSSKLAVCWEKTHNLGQLLFTQDSANQHMVESSIFVAMNNVQVSAAHIQTLKQHLQNHTNQVFEHTPNAIRMATQCLDGLRDTSESYMRIVHQYIKKFVKDQVSKMNGPNALGSLLERFGQQNYELKEQDYLTREANDSYIPTLLEKLQSEQKSMQGRLTENNLELVLHSLTNHLVETIETAAMRKRFTFWGGLQFDKDIRKIASLLNTMCDKPVRDKFSRLIQIASLLQVDKVDEVLDYWTSDSQVWRLSPMDVKAVLCLRRDFSKAEIMKLQL